MINFSDMLLTRDTYTACSEWCMDQIPRLCAQAESWPDVIVFAALVLGASCYVVPDRWRIREHLFFGCVMLLTSYFVAKYYL